MFQLEHGFKIVSIDVINTIKILWDFGFWAGFGKYSYRNRNLRTYADQFRTNTYVGV